MIRCKWLSTDASIPLGDIGNSISGKKFTVDAGFGFELRERGRDFLSADCVTRIKETRRIENPFGEIELLHFDSYERVSFTLRASGGTALLIRVSQPPRSLSSLINALEHVLAQKIYLSQVLLPLDLIKQALADFTFKLISAELGSVLYGSNMVGKALITATEGHYLTKLGVLSKVPHQIEGFRALAISNGESAVLTVTRLHNIVLRGSLSHAVLERIEALLSSNVH